MRRILLLSNGHGEDLSGALIGNKLKELGNKVEALPLVGLGYQYSKSGIPIIGETKEFMTGGFGYNSIKYRFQELINGSIIYALARIQKLLFIARRYDLIIAVGDVIPVVSAWLTFKPVVVYLVAYSSHYEGTLKLPWPCKFCLCSERFLGIFSRDKLTSYDLTKQLSRPVVFSGNPFMDNVYKATQKLPYHQLRLGILPGSRRPELDNNLSLTLKVIERLPTETFNSKDLSVDIALVSSIDISELKTLVSSLNWKIILLNNVFNTIQLIKGSIKINIHFNRFVEVLQSSDVLLCMAGTAAEQAVGLAKPVVQIPGIGPQFTSKFAEAQRRLLGPTVFCAESNHYQQNIFDETAALIMQVLERSQKDVYLKKKCKELAETRLGSQGATSRISISINEMLSKKPND